MKLSQPDECDEVYFILPLERPDNEDEVDILDVQVRVNLLMMIYRWSIVEKLPDVTVDARLEEFHSKFMDLSTELGRFKDHWSYWGAVFMCAMNPELMERWSFAEKYLFDFRFRAYFKDVNSVVGLIKFNIKSIKNVNIVKTSEGVTCFKVPWETAYNLICTGAPLVGGQVILQASQLHHWIWNSMKATYTRLLREIHPKAPDIRSVGVDEGESSLVLKCDEVLNAALSVESEIHKVRKKRHRERYGGPPGAITDIEDLVSAAKNLYPPCQARHVHEASVYGKHPKHEARKAYMLFCLEAGHDVEEVELSLHELWNCDEAAKSNKRMFPKGFSKETFLSSCTDVEGIEGAMTRASEPIRAFGCWGLEKKSKSSGTSCAGCPFSGSYDEKPLLKWMGLSDEQIADVLSKGGDVSTTSNQAKCTRVFAIKTGSNRTIKHPNMYYREAGHAQRPTKRSF